MCHRPHWCKLGATGICFRSNGAEQPELVRALQVRVGRAKTNHVAHESDDRSRYDDMMFYDYPASAKPGLILN